MQEIENGGFIFLKIGILKRLFMIGKEFQRRQSLQTTIRKLLKD
jgi:hypothetical protein